MRQLVYIIFISNNCASLNLWSKQTLVKNWKGLICYENDFLQSFLLVFMILLTTEFVIVRHILAIIYFAFLKSLLKQNWNSFNPKFPPQWKDSKTSYQVRHIPAHFCNLIALVLGSNSVIDVSVTKNIKELTFEGVWGIYNQKRIPETTIGKISEMSCIFHVKYCTMEKLIFCFFKTLMLVPTKTLFL